MPDMTTDKLIKTGDAGGFNNIVKGHYMDIKLVQKEKSG